VKFLNEILFAVNVLVVHAYKLV